MVEDKKEYLTQEKFDELKKELDYLTGTKRKEVAETLEYAKSLGDLSENAEYHRAKELQGELESRITRLASVLKDAEIVKPRHGGTVGVGSTVVVQKEGSEEQKTFYLVGSEEADTQTGKISLNSPLGQAMMDKKEGDSFTFMTPLGKTVNYKITKVE